MVTEKNTVIEIKADDLCGRAVLKIIAVKKIRQVNLEISEGIGGRRFCFQYACDDASFEENFQIENPLLWSLSSPRLYGFKLKIVYAEGEEAVTGNFGFRTISSNGREICLNGSPVFVRGFIRGATAHDHRNNCRLPEEEFYRKSIKEAKKFGFNFVRFHSTIPSEAFFRVADEEGILIHIEFRKPEDIYNNLREMTDNGSMVVPDGYIREIIRKLYNHPSLCVYCVGNEIRHLASNERIDEIFKLVRSEDDTRLFIDTCAWGENNRSNIDIDVQHMSYYFPFNKHADMYENTENLLVVGADENRPLQSEGFRSSVSRELYFNVPLIAHEVCHYTALRDYKTLKEKFDRYGAEYPWWLNEELKMIKAKGYEKCYDEMYRASKYFQFECWKTAFEALRGSKLLAGFHFLQFADTDVYENSNGIVDCFDDENVISPEEFFGFNGNRVLLAELGDRLFEAGAEISFPVSLSNYGEDDIKYADFCYRFTAEDGTVCAEGRLKNTDISRKGVNRLCKVSVDLPQMESSGKLLFEVMLCNEREIYAHNEWKIWIYRKRERWTYRDFVSYRKDGVTITNDAEEAFDGLSRGERVCLIYRQEWTRHVARKEMEKPKYAFKASWNRFKPVIWDRGTNFGGICNDELLKKYGFATDGFYDFNYGTISEDCDKINLDDFPCEVESLVSGIDKSSRDRFDAYKECFNLPELMYDRTLRNYSYLFELTAGKGKLLVCGFNLTGLDENEPSSRCMAECIRAYISGDDFAPKHGTDLRTLKEYMKKCAEKPVKERMMTQFWALDDAPVESAKFWKESKEYLIGE